MLARDALQYLRGLNGLPMSAWVRRGSQEHRRYNQGAFDRKTGRGNRYFITDGNGIKNPIDIAHEVADSMTGIGGIPSAQEFYDEFDSSLRAALGLSQKQVK